jgi:hypothetical protein
MGPVQVLVVGFGEPTFSGEVMAELTRLGDAGIVRLVDLLLVSRDEDGNLETLAGPDGEGTGRGVLVAEVLGRPEPAGDDADVAGSEPAAAGMWSLADAVPVGSIAAVALVEHVWAAPLRAAIQRAGGSPLDETWLAPEDLEKLERLIAHEGNGEFGGSSTLIDPRTSPLGRDVDPS